MNSIVIILTYNGEKYIKKCLDSVLSTKGKFDILVIDNKSKDNTRKILKQYHQIIKLIFLDENLGFAGGNNIGFRYAIENKYKFAILLNQDTIVDKYWFVNLIKVFKDEKVGAAQSLIMLYKNRELINTIGNKMNFLGFGRVNGLGKKISEVDLKYEIGYVSGASACFRVDILKKTGLFDEYFFCYHEDLDLSYRIKKLGYKLVLAKDSIVYHDYEFLSNTKKIYLSERNRLIFLFSIYKLYMYIILMPLIILSEIFMIFYSIKTHSFLEKLRAYLGVLKSFEHIYKKRKRIMEMKNI